MKILITGANGFIGTYLSRELQIAGHDVVGVDREDGDLTVFDVADRLVVKHRPDVLIHLAAKIGRLFGEEDPQETVNANVTTTIYIAQACAKHKVRLVYGSTSEAFGDNGERSVDETEHGVLPHISMACRSDGGRKPLDYTPGTVCRFSGSPCRTVQGFPPVGGGRLC